MKVIHYALACVTFLGLSYLSVLLIYSSREYIFPIVFNVAKVKTIKDANSMLLKDGENKLWYKDSREVDNLKERVEKDQEDAEWFANVLNFSDASQCVPDYEYLMEVQKSGTGMRKTPATSLKLIAAYEYERYSVVALETDGWHGREVFCRYLSSSFSEMGIPVRSSVFPEFAVHCCRRPGASYMTITEKKDDPIIQWAPVLDRSKKPIYQLSLCLAPMYGNESQWLLLAETIEHYKLQGVEHFYLYVKDVDDYSRMLVTSYVSSGEAEVVYFDHRQDRAEKEWHMVGIQDCVQRARNHSRYAIFADIDERITPSTNISLLNLTLQTFDNNPTAGSIQFRPRWILRDSKPPDAYTDESTVDSHLPTKTFHNTTWWPPAGHTAKCIIDPNRVLIMWIHYPEKFMPGNFAIYRIDPEAAIVRHYRDMQGWNWGERYLPTVATFGPLTNTDYPEYLMDRLIANVKNRLNRVYSEKIVK